MRLFPTESDKYECNPMGVMSSNPTPTTEEIHDPFESDGTVSPLFTDDIADRTDYPVDATEGRFCYNQSGRTDRFAIANPVSHSAMSEAA